MRRIVLFVQSALLALAGFTSAWAAAPSLLTYQGRVKQNGVPVNGAQTVELFICSTASGPSDPALDTGNCSTTGAQSVTVTNGLFRSTFTTPASWVGSGTDLSSGVWYLAVKVAGVGLTPREQLTAAPYSIFASTAASVLAGSVDTTKLAADAVDSTKLLNGAVTFGKLSSTGCSASQFLEWTGSAWTCANSAGGPPSGPAGGDLTGGYPNPTIATGVVDTTKLAADAVDSTKLLNGAVAFSKLASTGCSNQQVLEFTSGAWSCQNPPAGAPTGGAGGDLTGTYPNPTIAVGVVDTTKLAADAVDSTKLLNGAVTASKLATTGVIAGNYGSPTQIPSITIDPQGRVTSANVQAIGAAGGAAGGDLTGTYPNPSIGAGVVSTAKIAADAVDSTKLLNGAVTFAKITTAGCSSSGQVLEYNGSVWTCQSAPGGAPTGGAGGDLTGSYPNPTLASITSGGSFGGSTLVPSITVDAKGRVTAASNVAITGVTPGGSAGGDLTGTYPGPTISAGVVSTAKIAADAVDSTKLLNGAVTFAKITTAGCSSSGQVLEYNGSAWTCQSAPSGAPTGNAGGDLTGSSYPNPTIAAGVVSTTKIAADAVDSTKLIAGAVSSLAAGAYGNNNSPFSLLKLTFDGKGRITGQSDTVPTLNSASFWLGSAGNVPTAVTLSGDATLNNAGSLTISAGAVSTAKIAADAVDSTKLLNGAVTFAKIAGGCSNGQVLGFNGSAWGCATPGAGSAGGDLTGTYPNPTIAAGVVSTTKIAADAVDSTKLIAGAVSGITAGTVGNTFAPFSLLQLTFDAKGRITGASDSKPNLASGNIWVGSSGGTAAAVTMGGDATLNNAGSLTISAGAVSTSKIAADAVDSTKLLNGAVTFSKLVNGASAGCSSTQFLEWSGTAWTCANSAGGPPTGTAGGDLSGSYPNPTINAGAVSTSKIAADAVITASILDASVQTSKIAPDAVGTAQLLSLSPSPAGTYGSSNQIPVITVDSKGRVTSASPTTMNLGGTSLPAGDLWVGNGSNVAAQVALTGNASLSSSGALTINSGAIDSTKLASSAVTAPKIASSAVDTTKLAGCGSSGALMWNGSTWSCATDILMAPSAPQSDGSTGPEISINKTVGNGLLLRLQTGGVDTFKIYASGDVSLGNTGSKAIGPEQSTSGTGSDFTVQAASGVATGGSGGNVILQAGNALGTAFNGGNVFLRPGNAGGTGTMGEIVFDGSNSSPHLHTQGPTPSTLSSTCNAGADTVSMNSGSTDTAGQVTLGGATTSGCTISVTFKAGYSAPPWLILSPANAAAVNSQAFGTATGTSFTITINTTTAQTSPSWYYFVIQ